MRPPNRVVELAFFRRISRRATSVREKQGKTLGKLSGLRQTYVKRSELPSSNQLLIVFGELWPSFGLTGRGVELAAVSARVREIRPVCARLRPTTGSVSASCLPELL